MRTARWQDLAYLDETFPLPLDRPFTAAEARRDGGLTYDVLAPLVARGFLRHPIRGVYVAAQVPDTLSLRCACLRLVVPADCVVVDRHAGWLHGAEMVLAPNEHIERQPVRVFRPAGRGRLRNGLTDSGERNLSASDITEVEGLRVSTPLRTAWDLGRQRWTDRAIAGVDQMLRLRNFEKEELLAGIERFRGMRWITTLRAIAPLADGRAESPPESVLRLRWLEANLPAPEPQVEVWQDGTFLARVDLGHRELRFAAEYDGAEWHSTPEQLAHDRARRTVLTREADWHVVAVRRDNLFGRWQDAEVLLRRGIELARQR
ncbi:hypothetical protein KUV85_04585 [Nocardioides panacisoli]|uniref:hypothetical protein n=1 Tax=Nocardioides panacisoli TaxID=627624 RepID=UPI001C62E233|nr:hypothetical protein [Nocardioides panacisoli]QYJ04970.1 hypothetical protein KUV85_04585 [Nocardioides panacisoli]